MEISRNWLAEWIDLDGVSDEELDSELTRIGHAVEATRQAGDDRILDLEITTNRVDAMSHRGLARELGAVMSRPIREVEPLAEIQNTDPVDIRIEEGSGCTRFAGLLIRGVDVKPSPSWLVERLESLGHRSVNNIVDATNFVMLDLGHPLHAFDYDLLAQNRIVVRRGVDGERIETLDGENREIDEDTIVVADGSGPVALGGVMGGASTEISESTKNCLLECAWFDPATIRLTARRLNMKTDASYRFERGMDPNDVEESIRRCAALVIELAGGEVDGFTDAIAVKQPAVVLNLRSSRLAEISDGSIDIETAARLLGGLGMESSKVGEDLEVTVPTWRRDVTQEIDLLEEVLRLEGYQKIGSSLPRLTTGDVERDAIRDLEDDLRDRMTGYGFDEVVTYSFQRKAALEAFSDEEPIMVENALSETVEAMRTSILPGLLDVAAGNWNRGNRDGRIFEVGRTYHRRGNRHVERPVLGCVLWGGEEKHFGGAPRGFDLYDAKGVVEAIAEWRAVQIAWDAADAIWSEPGRGAEASAGVESAAVIGEVSKKIRGALGMKTNVVAAEIALEPLDVQVARRAREVSKFPGVPMVLALRHTAELSWEKIRRAIEAIDEELLVDAGLWDRYQPDGSEEVKTTLAMWYQSLERSLSQEEVSEIHERIAQRLLSELPVERVEGER